MPLTSTSVPTFRSAHGAEKPVASFVRIIPDRAAGRGDGERQVPRVAGSLGEGCDSAAHHDFARRRRRLLHLDDVRDERRGPGGDADRAADAHPLPDREILGTSQQGASVLDRRGSRRDLDDRLFTTSRAGGCFAWIVPSSSFFCPAFTRESELMTGTAPPTTITIRTDSPEPTEPASSVTSSPPPLILRTTSPAGTPFSSNSHSPRPATTRRSRPPGSTGCP